MLMQVNEIAGKFAIQGEIADIKPLGEGFINDTFLVRTVGDTPDYILQRKNHIVFPNVPEMMDNIVRVTAHIKNKVAQAGGDPMRESLTVVFTHDGLPYYYDEPNYWAVCVFIAGSVTIDNATSLDLCYKGGQGIGRFQKMLADFTSPLYETIKGFHNIKFRYEQWDDTIRRDKFGLVETVREEIKWVEDRRQQMLDFWKLVENGELPMRVTHNDTKLSNILFDKDGEVLCAIDLDTCMSSTALNDVGDALRSYTNTGAEDDQDLSRVSMDINRFRSYVAGYLSEMKDALNDCEKEWLAFSAIYITFEQVLRFLMDYIDGSTYWKIQYPTHTLVRTQAQYKLLQSMEEQYPEMRRIVKELL
ncbi:MAG: aminoglycoside phosphotransferase family protein [Bacteroidaceae bacterium]|nr:aminoglycoside phosphotransferase family protein [Bacteroidaceae bacterium]